MIEIISIVAALIHNSFALHRREKFADKSLRISATSYEIDIVALKAFVILAH